MRKKKEEWRPVKGFEEVYMISSWGRWKTIADQYGKPIDYIHKVHVGKRGYPEAHLKYKDKKRCTVIHRLVAEAFLPTTPGKPDVNHKDGDRTNNYVDNLEWVNRRENLSHGKMSKKCSSKFVGVRKMVNKTYTSWKALIELTPTNGERRCIQLGSYLTEIEAAYAYILALKKYKLINTHAEELFNKHKHLLKIKGRLRRPSRGKIHKFY